MLIATPARTPRSVLIAAILAVALVVSGAVAAAQPARAAEAAPLKAVFIVGPTGAQTATNLEDAEELAQIAESYGMDVRRVFHPNATWEAVLANVQGANLVYYAGHGYGWPSPYTKTMTESRQNGIGINSFAGSDTHTYTYYGANPIRQNWVLAPNAIVFLNHGCYTAGNGEPGTAIPSWDVARQRVDNYANGFLAAGARAVYAYSYQSFGSTLRDLHTTDMTIEDIFRVPGYRPTPSFGWVGWDPRRFDSVRTPGAENLLDPHETQGFLRAVSGDLSMTASEWRGGGAGNSEAPTLSAFSVTPPAGPTFGQSATPFFTPNGDGVTDTLDLAFSVDGEAFVDFSIENASGNVVRTMSTWSAGGQGSATWNGRNDSGSTVADGRYTVTATPRNRGGTSGASESVDVDVLTTMSSPAASPTLFHPGDGDEFAPATTLSVSLESSATFWWKIADSNGNVVRTYVNGVNTSAGNLSWVWDGRDTDGDFVPSGTYYSVTTAATSAGTYYHSVALDVQAFRLTTKNPPPFVRGGKTKVFVYSAEPLAGRPKVKLYLPGLAPQTYRTTALASGAGWYAVVTFSATAQPGTMVMRVVGKDQNFQVQQTDYSFELE